MKKMVSATILVLMISILMLVFIIQLAESPEPPPTEWSRTYGGTDEDVAASVVETSDGGYVLAGKTYLFGAGNWDGWLVKTNSTGDMQWNRTFGGTDDDVLSSVVQATDGGLTLAGSTKSFGAGNWDFWLAKTNSTGHMRWNKTYGGASEDSVTSLIRTNDGGYAMTGYTGRYDGPCDIWLVKTNSTGHMEWNQTYHNDYVDQAKVVIETMDGGYALAGVTGPSGLYRDIWLVKTDSVGNMQWNKTYGGASEDRVESLIQASDGGYVLAGWTESFGAGSHDFWLIKLAPEEIPAIIDIDPDTLNLKSNGQWITAYIELPNGYSLSEIDVFSILLNGSIRVDPEAPTEVGDHDMDSTPDLMLKFERASIIEFLGAVDYSEATGKSVEVALMITGNVAGTPFEGVDTIRVLLKG